MFWLQAAGLLVEVAILLALVAILRTLAVVVKHLQRSARGNSDLLLAAKELLEKVLRMGTKK